ncbi:hypothetical protein ACJX0J_011292, partial [Zea mays]
SSSSSSSTLSSSSSFCAISHHDKQLKRGGVSGSTRNTLKKLAPHFQSPHHDRSIFFPVHTSLRDAFDVRFDGVNQPSLGTIEFNTYLCMNTCINYYYNIADDYYKYSIDKQNRHNYAIVVPVLFCIVLGLKRDLRGKPNMWQFEENQLQQLQRGFVITAEWDG